MKGTRKPSRSRKTLAAGRSARSGSRLRPPKKGPRIPARPPAAGAGASAGGLEAELRDRHLEVALLNSDLRNLLSSIEAAIVMVDAQGRVRRFTPAAEKVLKIAATDIGRLIEDVRGNFDLSDLKDPLARVVGTARPFEHELQSREGKWYSLRIHPCRTLDDQVDGAIVLLFDIDLLKSAIEHMHRSRDYAEALLETVREPLVLLDRRLQIRTANRPFFETFHVFPTEIEGKSLFQLDGGWKGSEGTLRSPLEGVIRDNQALRDFHFELAVEGTGKKILVANARPVQVPGEPESLLLLAVEDVTERFRAMAELQDSEARYRRLFEAAREAIWLLDGTTGEILDTNPFSTELFGFARDELVGRVPWTLPLYVKPDEAKKRFGQALHTGQGFTPDVAMKTREGGILRIEKISSVYTVGNRKVVQSNMRDRTERRRLEEQLRHAQKMESIGTLAGGIAHDFNNILNIISAYSTLLARSSSAEKRAQSAEAIEKAVERGAALVRQLLTFARHEVLKFEPVDVNAIVSEVASMIKETFPRSITIALDLTAELPKINADATQLHQALLNLCVNARDAMPEGGTLLLATALARGEVLRARRADAGDDSYVCIGVADTGIGMDKETRNRIFEPFFTTKGKERGSGLGLAVVYGVAETHGGFVEVNSEPGGGSRFSIYLPMRSPDTEREHRQRDESPGRRRGRNETILVVEDEELLLDSMKSLIESEGYRVLAAKDGIEALEIYGRHREEVAVVLADLDLPRLGGWEAFLEMRKMTPTVRAVFMSGTNDSNQRVGMRKQGVRVAIRKPFTATEMIGAIRNALRPPAGQ